MLYIERMPAKVRRDSGENEIIAKNKVIKRRKLITMTLAFLDIMNLIGLITTTTHLIN